MKSFSPLLQSSRRGAVKAIVAAISIGLMGAGAAFAQVPKSPLTINVVDVAGNLALTQDAFELYARRIRTWSPSSCSPRRRPPSFRAS